MIGTTSPPNERSAADSGLSRHLLALLASLAGYFRARLELAGIEGKEAAAIYLKAAVLIAVALLLFAFGYAFLWIGLIALIAAVSHLAWGWLVLGAGFLHVVGALAGGWMAVVLCKKPVFGSTVEEFRKDQQWLESHK